MNKLKGYYYFVGVPIAFVILGSALFFSQIVNTVKGNPHPQINYIIFMLIAVGCFLMAQHVWRINREGNLIARFFAAARGKAPGAALGAVLGSARGGPDVGGLLGMLVELVGKPVNGVQHAAVEAELERYSALQNRRLLLAQFMAGLMVGMGLLGTFIGLLGALAEIGNLIGSFASGGNFADPIAAVNSLVARLTAPMQAMGVAFSASLFGVLGSLIMGILLVGVRSASSELVSIVRSRTSHLLDISAPDELEVPDFDPLNEALAGLAEQSPLLKGLGLALDQSERRVRELISSVTQLSAKVEMGAQSLDGTSDVLRQQASHAALLPDTLVDVQNSLGAMLRQQSVLLEEGRMNASEREHSRLQMERFMERQQATLDAQLQSTHAAVGEETQAQRQEFQRILQVLVTQAGQSQSAQVTALREHLNMANQQLQVQGRKSSEGAQVLVHGQQTQQSLNERLAGLLAQVAGAMQEDARVRSEAALRLELMLTEAQARTEQMLGGIEHLLSSRIASPA